MKVNDLIEFLEYSDRTSPVVVGIAGDDGRVRTCDDVLFLRHEDRVYLIVEPGALPAEEPESVDAIRRTDFERPQMFGHNFVLLQKSPQR